MKGYLRSNGQKGIRNVIVVAYLVECAHHVAREIVSQFGDESVQVIGFSGCYPNDYALDMMEKLCTHANVGGVVLVSLGCESFNREQLARTVEASDRPLSTLIIQESGGTKSSIDSGVQTVTQMKAQLENVPQVDISVDELVIGTICGGSDGTSGISANPAVGHCFDRLIADGATCIFEETGELIGCEHIMSDRAYTGELGQEIVAVVDKAEHYYREMGFGSFSPGNADGGLTTLEEKSMGAYAKSGSSKIHGLIKPGEQVSQGGLYLMDVVPDGGPRFGFPNISDNAEIVELIASGCHIVLFTTGRGSVVGSAISPVIKICANPETYRKLEGDMDINAGKIIEGHASIETVGAEIYQGIMATANGEKTKSEALGHQEFVLTYKQFEASGPACLPRR